MKAVTLNAKKMTSIEDTHRYLKARLRFPLHYGENLDALWDILTTISEPLSVKLINPDKLHENLGEYGANLLSVFVEADQLNENLCFEVLHTPQE
jgi:ribonuclease inhibitor